MSFWRFARPKWRRADFFATGWNPFFWASAGNPFLGANLRLSLLAALILLGATACSRPQLHQQESFVFGTQVEITIADAAESEARTAAEAVFAEFDRLHRLLHAWQPSELTRVNEAIAAGRSHAPPVEVLALIGDAQRIAAAGEHLFDPGIGRLIARWGFQSDEFKPLRPDSAVLAEWRRQRPSIADLRIVDGRIRSAKREVALDLGGYGKGVALDRAAEILRQRGVRNALINIGGNVMALGNKHGTPWKVGIRQPRGSGYLASLELFDGEAIGTSGDYQRYFELDGRRYSHLLDPRTGEPAQGTQAVTVLISPGPSPLAGGVGMRSDALSKPLFIAGAADWTRLAARVGVLAALRVDADGRIEVTEALAKRLSWPAGAAVAKVVRLPAPEVR